MARAAGPKTATVLRFLCHVFRYDHPPVLAASVSPARPHSPGLRGCPPPGAASSLQARVSVCCCPLPRAAPVPRAPCWPCWWPRGFPAGDGPSAAQGVTHTTAPHAAPRDAARAPAAPACMSLPGHPLWPPCSPGVSPTPALECPAGGAHSSQRFPSPSCLYHLQAATPPSRGLRVRPGHQHPRSQHTSHPPRPPAPHHGRPCGSLGTRGPQSLPTAAWLSAGNLS